MLPDIIDFEESVSLIGDTGIQFMDFALSINLRKEPAGEFAPLNNGLVTRLFLDREKDTFFYESAPGSIVSGRPIFSLPMDASLALFDGQWVPMPFFRYIPPNRFDEGPSNWCRLRIVRLPEPDIDGNTHRLTLAFDTRVMPDNASTAYLAPQAEDVRSGVTFKLATSTSQTRWFLDMAWVKEWLLEIFQEGNKKRLAEDIQHDVRDNHHLAHYLNLLSLFRQPHLAEQAERGAHVEIPEIKVIANGADQHFKPIPVDLVLDVGNSRTCGILIENHGQSASGLKQNYVLELRDLLEPEHVYTQPFESRVEFSQAFFGKDHLSVRSGRHEAFLWPTIARVGAEAGRLASRRRGTEGSTGLSSPKRYLWDESPYGHGWRFNCAYVRTDTEPYATASPFSDLISEVGEALYRLDEDDRYPVFTPRYSRSSLMTFMLAEVLSQALSQINSPAQRSRQGHARVPRQLNSIILTVPPGMPTAERSILDERMRQAVGLVWKSLGWHEGDDDPYNAQAHTPARIPIPSVRVEWDEASCGQLVYLYTEINENFAGHPEEFFGTLARPGKTDRERVTVATIDIGGGTTDLVITDYALDRGVGGSGSGSNAEIVPIQRFRDGFKVAGDDILLDVIQMYVLPGFEKALGAAGVVAPHALMSRLCGGETVSAQDAILRQQLNLQVFVPLGLLLLKDYESYDPLVVQPTQERTYGEWLGTANVSSAVKAYVDGAVRRELGAHHGFDLFTVSLALQSPQIHADFLRDKFNLCKTLNALSEVVACYECDVLLLTGRPSRLPGIQSFLRRMLSLPPGRILPMQSYRTGGWYPFHRNGLIDDPKSTAAVGAMLCLLCDGGNIPNFYFRTSALRPYSTIRHMGMIDSNNVIKDADILYRNIVSRNGQIELPQVGDGDEAETPQLEMRGDLRLGFRQLDAQRWPAAPLYSLRLTQRGREKQRQITTETGTPPVLRIRFAVKDDAKKRRQGIVSDRLVIESVEPNTFSTRDLDLELNTMLDAGLSDSRYWLDSGSVKRK